MKTPNAKLYLEMLNDYFDGQGLGIDNCSLCKKDIPDMMAFYARILKPEIFVGISEYVISVLTE